MRCSKCKTELYKKVKTCPNCGKPIRSLSFKIAKFLGVSFLIFLMMSVGLILILDPDPSKEQKRFFGKAFAYKVIRADDYSYPEMKRLRWVIVSNEAKTFQNRALTVIQAAKKLQKETQADEATAYLEDNSSKNKGQITAIATYTPGKKDGEWEVESRKNAGSSMSKFSYAGEKYNILGGKAVESIQNPISFSKSKCETNLKCWGDKHEIDVLTRAPQLIERFAKHNFKWTSGMLSPKFSRYLWKDEEKSIVTYIGDKIQFQNGFGVWQNYIYECDYDPNTKRILDVRVGVGRL